jgi:FtsP/CotA-like multicopper oxidase with cupredoxin domain
MIFARVPLLLFVLLPFAAAGDAAAQTPFSQTTAAQSPAQSSSNEACPRPAPSSSIPEPPDLRSENGVLEVQVAFRNELDANGHIRYCYVFGDGLRSPNLRLRPGDLLILTLQNDLTALATAPAAANVANAAAANKSAIAPVATGTPASSSGPCGDMRMTATSTNLHFHGLTIPPVCHQDDVLRTSIQPGDPPFEYHFRIPADQPPGLYWYHPHLHGFSRAQVVGGASGALIVEGIERENREAAGLPERILVIRDQDLLNPNAAPATNGTQAPAALLDRDGDARNTGDGSGKPAKDLSVNFVASAYPDYRAGTIEIKPAARELWRIVNASSITYLNLQLLFAGKAQSFGIVAVDGIPINQNGLAGGDLVVWQNHLGVPPGGRIEVVVTAPAAGVEATLITRAVNTGPGGENDPTRPIAKIVSAADAPAPRSTLAAPSSNATVPQPPPQRTWLGKVQPTRTRRLYFSEKLDDPKDPNSPTTFYLTVEGQEPAPFDPHSSVPNIVVHQGDVEDWVIENRSQEVHDFHIHQVHFLMLEWFGIPINEPFLRDTINVPFWDGKTVQYPTVRLRMDFRDPNAIGLFPFHCHLLEHEDGGMMGLIRVEPAEKPSDKPAPPAGKMRPASAKSPAAR